MKAFFARRPAIVQPIIRSIRNVFQLCDECCVGSHMKKYPTLLETVMTLPDVKKPYQIFLGNPQSLFVKVAPADIAAAGAYVKAQGLHVYVHTQYTINLCNNDAERMRDDMRASLRQQLKIACELGCRGVVVHVGKSCKTPVKEALEVMRQNILAVLEAGSYDCPLLLETPAGQGTETLTKKEDFIQFVAAINDPRFGICVDTCHVFASGYDPLEYLSAAPYGLIRLVHFNDSLTPLGSKKDRHALCGTGYIGIKKMNAVADLCYANKWDMVIE
jgi:deoxyribonuclease-4